ncbi:MAG: hypothetical protein JW955_17640 [Sedimentisphaerales bacterium]|nr:hypothetical protein [Sedimentisphaerales bacterium]
MKWLSVVAMLAVVTPAYGAVTFDFEGATVGGVAPDYVASANQFVTDYMTAVYGSPVTATGAAAWTNDDAGDDWTGKTGTDKWLRTYGSASVTPGVFQISFDAVPVLAGSFEAYVFEATPGADFTVSFYTSGYGDRYNPNPAALLGTLPTDFGVGGMVISFVSPTPVALIVCSDEGWHDIGIDNLIATSVVPAPGAILLGTIGVGLVGWFRRRRAL